METNTVLLGDCLAELKKMATASVDLFIGSPPYAGKGQRYLGRSKKWTTAEWVPWMAQVTCEAVRVSRGYVFWVVNGFVKNGRYEPACEGLKWVCWTHGIICDRPLIWHKNAPPNRKDYFGNDWEFILAFKAKPKVGVFNWQDVAKAPKYTSGGQFRQRGANGKRRLGNAYPKVKLARPRDVIRATVGGGHMGSDLAHLNEAPFPEKLIEPLVLAFSNRGGLVCDPFCGSGTTLAVAEKHGRQWLGIECHQSQVDLSLRRIAEVRQTCSVSI